MMKKEYRKPTAKAFCIETTSVLCTSGTNISADPVPYEDENNTYVKSKINNGIWGTTNTPD